MSEFFWTLLKIGGYTLIALFSLVVALVVAMLALVVSCLLACWRRKRTQVRQRARENAEMHERIRMYLRDTNKEGSNEQA